MNRDIASSFISFAEHECENSSALYCHLSHKIAVDNEILLLAANCRTDQPVPNMLFAAVHYLLSRDASHPLAAFYPSINAGARSPQGVFKQFKAFCLLRSDKIIALLGSRLVQTNEVRRCAYLYPAILTGLLRIKPGRDLALIEVGTSAGLNLLPDKYQYSDRKGMVYGAKESNLKLETEFIGHYPMVLQQGFPKVSHRIGIDLNIIDLQNKDEIDWLLALVWPEHHQRRALLQAALLVRAETEVKLYQGDGFAMLEEIVTQLPEHTLPCIYHTHVANQISTQAKQTLLANISALGQGRDLLHIYNNIKTNLHCTSISNGEERDFVLAQTDGHGRWIKWLAE